jgi:hypothetical protein
MNVRRNERPNSGGRLRLLKVGTLSKIFLLLGAAALAALLFVGFLPVPSNGCGSAFLPVEDADIVNVSDAEFWDAVLRYDCFRLYRTPRIIAGALGVLALLFFLAAFLFRSASEKTPPPPTNAPPAGWTSPQEYGQALPPAHFRQQPPTGPGPYPGPPRR